VLKNPPNKQNKYTKMESQLDLYKMRVRPAGMSEREKWRELMNEQHYLGFKGAAGEQVWYIAEDENERWIALIGWSSCAFKSAHRDKLIGWQSHIQMKRLKYIANNFRFLILQPYRIKNLASRILSLNIKRLSMDWEKYYDHPILMVETFVQDPYRGTCYLASNWQELGRTRGYGRHSGRYYYHGNKKKVFVYSLRRKAAERLRDPLYKIEKMEEEIMIINWKKLMFKNKDSLLSLLKKIPDARDNRGKRHPLAMILAISVCAMLSGARGYQGIYDFAKKLSHTDLKRLGAWSKTVPVYSTFREVLMKLNAQEFDKLIYGWLAKISLEKAEVISLDGKTLRGSHDGKSKAIHLLSALLMDEKITISQANVGKKTNEIPVLKETLQNLDIENKIITADAMHTQSETARVIVKEKKANYIFTVKDNQKKLKNKLKSLDYEAFPP
jgi:hypothetical protein